MSYLTMGSLELFKSLQIDSGYPIEFRQSGGLQAIQSSAQYDFIRDKVLGMRSQGYTVELLTPREALSIEPELNPELLGCMYSPGRGQADPVKATQAFASLAERSGAKVLTSHHVTAIQNSGDGSWRVTASGQEFRAGSLVLAAGAWCGQATPCPAKPQAACPHLNLLRNRCRVSASWKAQRLERIIEAKYSGS